MLERKLKRGTTLRRISALRDKKWLDEHTVKRFFLHPEHCTYTGLKEDIKLSQAKEKNCLVIVISAFLLVTVGTFLWIAILAFTPFKELANHSFWSVVYLIPVIVGFIWLGYGLCRELKERSRMIIPIAVHNHDGYEIRLLDDGRMVIVKFLNGIRFLDLQIKCVSDLIEETKALMEYIRENYKSERTLYNEEIFKVKDIPYDAQIIFYMDIIEKIYSVKKEEEFLVLNARLTRHYRKVFMQGLDDEINGVLQNYRAEDDFQMFYYYNETKANNVKIRLLSSILDPEFLDYLEQYVIKE